MGGGALFLAGRPEGRRAAGSELKAEVAAQGGAAAVRPGLALALAFGSGFVALSYEIVWFRAYAFASGGRALVFPILLGTILSGIALGSWLARRACRAAPGPALLLTLATVAATGAVLGYLLAPAVASISTLVPWWTTFPLVAAASAVLGAVFPLACHLGVPPGAGAGTGTSRLYLANIVGSAGGTLVTGFVLFDALPMAGIAALLLGVGLVLAVTARIAAARERRGWLGAGVFVSLLLTATLWTRFEGPYALMYERLYHGVGGGAARFQHVVETRSGVVTVTWSGEIQGSGAYDGWFSTDLVDDRNGDFRAYAISLWHAAPKEVLVIGLASGSWVQVLANAPGVEHVTVVEIDDGYLEVIPKFEAVASVLSDPRVTVVIDDGRRWLRRHPERRFDVVFQNTTQHWRGNVTNLLSREYVELVKAHLAPKGVFSWNTTWSKGAMRTGALAFPHAVRLGNFMVGSASPVVLDVERWRAALLGWRIDGRPVLDASNAAQAVRLEEILAIPRSLSAGYGDAKPSALANAETREGILERTRGYELVTDDNMGDEWLIDP